MEFRDNIFENSDSFTECKVWILISDSALLKSYALDKIKSKLLEENKLQNSMSHVILNTNTQHISDVDVEEDEEASLAICSLEDIWKKPNKTMAGRWWCKADYDTMSKKDRTNLWNYIKNPSKNAVLAITVSEWKNVIEFKRSNVLKTNKDCYLVNIQYPSKKTLIKILTQLFAEKNITLTYEQLDLFISKMGSAYEEYRDCVEKLAGNLRAILQVDENVMLKDIAPVNFKKAIKNIEHFEIDDLLRYMVRPLTSGQPLNGRRRIHKILANLLDNNTAETVCKRLKYRVRDMLTYRAAINNGIIPVKVPYNAAQAQEKLPENLSNSKIKKAVPFVFKRNAYLSSLTSIEDWFYIYSMLENISNTAGEFEYTKVLLNIVNRTAVSNDRLMNNIGIKNTLDEGLTILNGILYSDWWNSLEEITNV